MGIKNFRGKILTKQSKKILGWKLGQNLEEKILGSKFSIEGTFNFECKKKAVKIIQEKYSGPKIL